MTTIAEDFCMECDDQCTNERANEYSNECSNECTNECSNECSNLCCLTDSMNALNFNNNINTIMIAKLAEKLTQEMIYSKTFIKEKNGYNLNVQLPEWFNDLDSKYQIILIKIIEPILNHYIAQENANN
tara:strand:+ start:109 stop:495 length:387 start_codon:yes stop_codon:yes gene_type:complete